MVLNNCCMGYIKVWLVLNNFAGEFVSGAVRVLGRDGDRCRGEIRSESNGLDRDL